MRRNKTNRVIWHHALADEATVELIREWHLQRGFNDIGYHYLIRRDGELEHGRDVHEEGAHAMGMNHDSVGICFEGDFRKYEPSVEQLETASRIYHDLCRAYSKSLTIEFHRGIDNPCPGPKLDRDDFREVVGRNDPFADWRQV